jgi:tRNA threonylcarbamoyladenosine biosynthesis protein TsaE
MISNSPKETLRVGKVIAKYLLPGDIIFLSGSLGCGKTVMAKGIAAGLGVDPADVTSSSFVLIREHSGGRIPFYHFDLYRLNKAQDIASLGYEEYFSGRGVSVIEWPQRLACLIPESYLKVELEYEGLSKRKMKLLASGERFRKLIRKINEDIGV